MIKIEIFVNQERKNSTAGQVKKCKTFCLKAQVTGMETRNLVTLNVPWIGTTGHLRLSDNKNLDY